MVSIPSGWARKYNLKKGDEIEMTEHEYNLILGTKKRPDLMAKSIDISKLDLIVPRVVSGLYRRGYDELHIKFENSKLMIPVNKTIQEALVGYEIISQGRDRCVIKNIADALETEFNTMMRRTFVLLKLFSSGIIESMEHKSNDGIPGLFPFEDSINRTTNFCRRIINKNGLEDYKNNTYMYITNEELERIGDELKYLCFYLNESDKNIKNLSKKTVRLFMDMHELLLDMNRIFYKFDTHQLYQIFEKRKKIVKECHENFKSRCGSDVRVTHYVLVITQIIANILGFRLSMEL